MQENVRIMETFTEAFDELQNEKYTSIGCVRRFHEKMTALSKFNPRDFARRSRNVVRK